jgi:hypothetical protein
MQQDVERRYDPLMVALTDEGHNDFFISTGAQSANLEPFSVRMHLARRLA